MPFFIKMKKGLWHRIFAVNMILYNKSKLIKHFVKLVYLH